MLLTIDIGNTNIVFAVYDGKVQKGHWRCKTDAGRTADEYLAFLSQHFELKNLTLKSITDVIVSSVVPDVDFAIRQFCQNGFGCLPFFVGKDTGDIGVTVKIDKPSELGADRLVNAVAVQEDYVGQPVIVVDFGTATTFDVIGVDGSFCGGVIAPGPNLSLEALHLAAAKLPSVPVKKPKSALAKNTVDAMQSGIYWGYIGLVQKIVSSLKTEVGGDVKVIATGGLAVLFKDDIPEIDVLDDNLTLKGLLAIYERVKKL